VSPVRPRRICTGATGSSSASACWILADTGGSLTRSVKDQGHLAELAVGESSESFLVLGDAIRRLSEHDDRATVVVRQTVLAWFFALTLRLD
jgi:hypothetical protein